MPETGFSFFEQVYRDFNKIEYIHPDPLETVRLITNVRDREIAALIASSFALGRVASILAIIGEIHERLGSPDSIRRVILELSDREIAERFDGFVYRFYRSEHMAGLLKGIRTLIEEWGDLETCFLADDDPAQPTILTTLERFAERLFLSSGSSAKMIGRPSRGSSCKRLHLFLRWMVRHDEVDPGGWNQVSPKRLIVPVDVHMLRVAGIIGATDRRAPDAKSAAEITDFFRRIRPDDPVRYDFCLTRFGIHHDLNYEMLSAYIEDTSGKIDYIE